MDIGTEQQQGDALSEGRRIYLGNLLYAVTPSNIEDLLRESGYGDSLEKLHISVDPVSGRNPGYCFVEFTTREAADRVLESLPGKLLFNRPIKVGPCHPKTPHQSRWRGSRGAEYTPTFQRWGDWKGSPENAGRRAQPREEQGPYAAVQHIEERNSRPRSGINTTQLYIGGLDIMINQEHHDTEMQRLLEGFE
jgi:RNA recognition motif-containing protein